MLQRITLLIILATVSATAALSAQGSTPPNLTDPEVAHVAVTANAIDIAAGQVALATSTNAEVKKFAQTMITDHSAVNAQAGALAKKLGVTPADNAVSQSLVTGANTSKAALAKLKGVAFDKAYIDREVGYHQAVIDAIDKVLIPTTDNAELKKLLVDVRPAIVAHLDHARMIQKSLAK